MQPGAGWQQPGQFPWQQPAPNQFYAGWQQPGMFPWQQPAPQQPKVARVELPSFWIRDPKAWFGLAESTFARSGVAESKDKFDIVLKFLPEDTVEQIRSVLRAVDSLADPYHSLKVELIRLNSPNILEQLNGIVFAPELGGQAPSILMNRLLALLPDGEPAGLLFKHLFILRLPADIRDMVAKKLDKLEAKELAEYADSRWHVRNARPPPSGTVAAVEYGEVEEILETVAAMSLNTGKAGRRKRPVKKTSGDRQPARAYICQKHCRFGKDAWSCDDPKACTFQGNGPAGGN